MSENELDESYLDGMIAQHERSIAVFKEHLAVKVKNLELFVLDETESIRYLQALIEKHGQAMHHLLSTRMRRKSEGQIPPTPQAQAVQERSEEQIELEKEFKKGRPAPGFPVKPPLDADRGRFATTWTSDASPEWGPGDIIDDQGNRHVRKKGRHKIWDQSGRLISDEPDQEDVALTRLREMGYVDESGELTAAGQAALEAIEEKRSPEGEKKETPPETSNGVS